jgi:hypothetical protein
MSDQSREARVRRALRKIGWFGYALRKDRARSWNLDHQGGYMLVDLEHNFIVGGERYDWTLDDVEAWLAS